jgi:hypothetical protein
LDVAGEVDREKLYACLDAASREKAAVAAIASIEAGQATDQTVSTVLSLIFPLRPRREKPSLSASELSPLQKRAVRAISSAMEGGRRIFYGVFQDWGLPETTSGWRAFASDDGPPLR